jgi:dTDP-glucose 4,6-dehydratase
MAKIIYVTGCLGFIGYHVAKKCLDEGHYVMGVDKETYASDVGNLDRLMKYSKFKYTKCDINDLDKIFDCDYFINVAAETHVDNSIENSDAFLKSNVNGVHRLLELIKIKPKSRRPIFLHFSTDEVYGDIDNGSHSEKDMLKPSNPYAASKAAADMLILAWARTYDIPYVIIRPTNNYGIGQYVEKFIPKAVKHLTVGRPILLHDKGTPKRTWLHVSDTANAVMTIINSKVINEIYNISGNYETTNMVVAKKILKEFFKNKDYDFDSVVYANEVRPGQDVRYSIDDTKLRGLGWTPKADFDSQLPEIIQFYKHNFIW